MKFVAFCLTILIASANAHPHHHNPYYHHSPKHRDGRIRITRWGTKNDRAGGVGTGTFTNIFNDGRTQDLKRNACRSWDQSYRKGAKSAMIRFPSALQHGSMREEEHCKALLYDEIGCVGKPTDIIYNHEEPRCFNDLAASVWIDCSGSWRCPGVTLNETEHPPLLKSPYYNLMWQYPCPTDPSNPEACTFKQAETWQKKHSGPGEQSWVVNKMLSDA